MPRPDIAVYNFPQWHADPHNDRWHGKGWTEWELVKTARPRFEGHVQPVVPTWGYFDEADPAWSEKEIALAADHGIDAFIYDAYWYEDGPFLHRAIDEGFLRASNRQRLKFSLMWANHTWRNMHPTRYTQRAWQDETLAEGEISLDAFQAFARKVIGMYFPQPNYWRVAGGLYFSIYEIRSFVKGCGGLSGARLALDWFRQQTRDAGLGEIHLNAVIKRFGPWQINAPECCKALGIDSVTPYNWLDHFDLQRDGFPKASYRRCAAANQAIWSPHSPHYGVPYIASVTTGWDSSPRACTTDAYEDRGYPWLPILDGATPDAFKETLAAARDYFAAHPTALPALTINAWNEWTEGAFLLPDAQYGTGKLEALREIFGRRS